MKKNITQQLSIALISALVILSAGIGYRSYRVEQSLAEITKSAAQAQALAMIALNTLEARVDTLEDELLHAKNQSIILDASLKAKEEEVNTLANQVGAIMTNVALLEKKSKADPQLLKKYSKVYFLNENYVPAVLATIAFEYLEPANKPQQIHSSVWPFLDQLLKTAIASGIDIKILSAYRSFEEQATLKSAYSVTYGSGANKFSADQGYSEHQLGTTVDFTTSKLKQATADFKKTAAYPWLLANAYRYGFILSYPEGNEYYVFEPWHWRFVGVELATKLKNEGKHFYDLDQRTIDEYLVTMFDAQ